MKIVAVTRVRNEEDIIEPMVRHHAHLVDAHIVLDNGSIDRTPVILESLQAEGIALYVLKDYSAHFAETEQNTELYRVAVSRFDADWVVFLDADEFIDPRGLSSLGAFLSAVGSEHASIGVRLRDYVAAPVASDQTINVIERMSWCKAKPSDVWKVFVRRQPNPDDVVVDAGNHSIFLRGVFSCPWRQDALVLAHYPSRSPLQWAGKAITGWLKVLAAGAAEIRRNRSVHYANFFDHFLSDPYHCLTGAQNDAANRQNDPTLIEDPLPYLGGPLRYTRPVDYGWRALRLSLATAKEIAIAHGRLRDAEVTRTSPVHQGESAPSRVFRRAPVVEIATIGVGNTTSRPRAERQCYFPAATLDLPPFAFGPMVQEDVRRESQRGRMQCPEFAAWWFRDVLVHGACGILTLEDYVVEETLSDGSLHTIPGSANVGENQLRLPKHSHAATLPAAYHLLASSQENYFRWMIDVVSRFNLVQYDQIGVDDSAPGGAVVLVPYLDRFWKWEPINLLIPGRVPRLAVTSEGGIFVQRLLYVPRLVAEGFVPHPRLLDAFDALATAVLGSPSSRSTRPWRRLYIARTDSRRRVLANEAEIAAHAERAGFSRVVLSELPVPVQVQLFAEASHILAPHGAGLTNIVFCRPGTKLCELHMDRYVNWSFRRLAALRGLAYGCLVGEAVGTPGASVHDDTWRIDPALLDKILHDPRFLDS